MPGEVLRQPRAEEPSPRPLGVLVERVADPRSGELGDEVLRRYDAASVGELGATGLRGRTKGAADPQNLIWVMPAEEPAQWRKRRLS
jgi:hypothetical protein